MIAEKEVYEYIFSLNDKEEIKSLNLALKRRFDQINEMCVLTFKVGDKVEWTSHRSGTIERGTVAKIGRSCLTVSCDNGMRWKIPATMLKKVS